VEASTRRSAFLTGGSGFIGGRLIGRLLADGWTVKALARSEASADVVAALGAEPARGELADVGAMAAGMPGCDVVFHLAAHLGTWGDRAEFVAGNVTGTANALAAAREAGVRRFVHCGTEAALMHGRPLVNVDETTPLAPDSPALYSATKAQADALVGDAQGIETVRVRPRLVWGRGDTTLLPQIVEQVEAGRFAWIGGGEHLTATTHVDSVVEGLVLGAERGTPGEAYFVTDGEPAVFREFMTELIGTQGVEIPDKSVPAPVVRAAAAAGETLWRLLRLRGEPPVTRLAYWLASQECTIDIAKARAELGYRPVKSRAEGMAEMRGVGSGP
jgi:nucleoside-diphosphate-sugar epimerase